MTHASRLDPLHATVFPVDSIAKRIAEGTMWLPAMRFGQPVERAFDYTLHFSATR